MLANVFAADSPVQYSQSVRSEVSERSHFGMPKRAEIKAEHFADGLKIKPIACIPFDISVSMAGNNGQMIADVAPKSAVSKSVINIAETITGRKSANSAKKFDLKNFDLLHRLWRRH